MTSSGWSETAKTCDLPLCKLGAQVCCRLLVQRRAPLHHRHQFPVLGQLNYRLCHRRRPHPLRRRRIHLLLRSRLLRCRVPLLGCDWIFRHQEGAALRGTTAKGSISLSPADMKPVAVAGPFTRSSVRFQGTATCITCLTQEHGCAESFPERSSTISLLSALRSIQTKYRRLYLGFIETYQQGIPN